MPISQRVQKDLSILAIRTIGRLEELQAHGTCRQVAHLLECQTGVAFAETQWQSLFDTLVTLRCSVRQYERELSELVSASTTRPLKPFIDIKKRISELVGAPIKARSRKQLEDVVRQLISQCSADNALLRAQRFEHYKRSSFIASSRLEGIEIQTQQSKQSMAELVRRHKVSVLHG